MAAKLKNCRAETAVKVTSCGPSHIKVCASVKNWVASSETSGSIEEYDCYHDNGNLATAAKLYFREGGPAYTYPAEKTIDQQFRAKVGFV
jgi:hypothetical protein